MSKRESAVTPLNLCSMRTEVDNTNPQWNLSSYAPQAASQGYCHSKALADPGYAGDWTGTRDDGYLIAWGLIRRLGLRIGECAEIGEPDDPGCPVAQMDAGNWGGARLSE